MTKYWGKYPHRISEVWIEPSAVLQAERVAFFKVNRGDVYSLSARYTQGRLPQCGREAADYPEARLVRAGSRS